MLDCYRIVKNQNHVMSRNGYLFFSSQQFNDCMAQRIYSLRCVKTVFLEKFIIKLDWFTTVINLYFEVQLTALPINNSREFYIVVIVITHFVIFLCHCVRGNYIKYSRDICFYFSYYKLGCCQHEFSALFQHYYSLWDFARGTWILLLISATVSLKCFVKNWKKWVICTARCLKFYLFSL